MSRTAWATIIITALVGMAALAFMARGVYDHRPCIPTGAVVLIPAGSSFEKIISVLAEKNGLVHPFFFYVAEGIQGHHRFYPSGEFYLPAGLTYKELSLFLRRAKPVQHPIQVIEGSTVATVFESLKKHPLLTGELPDLPQEGTLFPETYHITRGASRQDVLNRMQAMMTKNLETLWEKRDPNLLLKTPAEALILASIVEKESGGNDDAKHVASVFLNRLKAGMPLQSDPTILYALSQGTGRLNRPLNRQDWSLESPYNTYLQPGLPPSPIAIPSVASLKAVLNPITTPYTYFVADGKGGHVFAVTLKDHNRHVRAFYRTKKEAQK
jgi:UPF0755 protein